MLLTTGRWPAAGHAVRVDAPHRSGSSAHRCRPKWNAEARRAESTSVQPSPRHALDPDEAYAAACRLLVPVELWPEFCLTVLVGGQRAAQLPLD